MAGLFGGLFDFDNDGEMNAFERAAEFAFLDDLFNEDEEDDEVDEQFTEFELSGLDADELEFMDPEERREILEEAGLDPDDYDF